MGKAARFHQRQLLEDHGGSPTVALSKSIPMFKMFKPMMILGISSPLLVPSTTKILAGSLRLCFRAPWLNPGEQLHGRVAIGSHSNCCGLCRWDFSQGITFEFDSLMHQISSNLEIKTSGESCSKPVNPTIQLRDGYCSPFLVEFEMVMCFSLMLGLLGPCVIFTALALLILTGGASGLIESWGIPDPAGSPAPALICCFILASEKWRE